MENEINRIDCPACGEQIILNDKQCKHCGSWFEESPEITENKKEINYEASSEEKGVVSEYSNVQSVRRLTFFIIITAGLYQIYWFYRNWRDLKAFKNLDINVGLRTLGLFVPLVNLYLIGNQFKDIKTYAEESGIKPFSIVLVAFLWVICMFMSFRLGLLLNPIALLLSWILTMALVIPFSMVQKTLNEYWIKEQGELPKKRISGGEILVVAVGVLLALMSLLIDFLSVLLM